MEPNGTSDVTPAIESFFRLVEPPGVWLDQLWEQAAVGVLLDQYWGAV